MPYLGYIGIPRQLSNEAPLYKYTFDAQETSEMTE